MKELTVKDIQDKIINLPNRPPFMLGNQLAAIYEVDTKQISQAVRRNPDRFPADFAFVLSKEETARLQNEGLTLHSGGHGPRAFTRFGANQLSTVLKSPIAAARSVQIMRAFSVMEEVAQNLADEDNAKLGEVIGIVGRVIGGRTDTHVEITKDEYIELLKNRNHLLEMMQSRRRKAVSPVPTTAEERMRMRELAGKGYSLNQIAGQIGRPRSTVWSVLSRVRRSN